jgi:hypothetical protein
LRFRNIRSAVQYRRHFGRWSRSEFGACMPLR